MTPDNSEMVKYRLECAQDALREAQTLLQKGLLRGTVNRSYYAMFYTAESLLATKRLSFSKHSAVIAAFRKEFVKSGKFPVTLGEWLQNAFEIRGDSDHEPFVKVDKTKAARLLRNAEQFVAKVCEMIQRESPSTGEL